MCFAGGSVGCDARCAWASPLATSADAPTDVMRGVVTSGPGKEVTMRVYTYVVRVDFAPSADAGATLAP